MNIELLFEQAVKQAAQINYPLAVDVRLRLYAYYKQAKSQPISGSSNEHELVNAFKLNAWMQVSYLTPEQAKIEYINLVNSIIKNDSL